MKLVVPSLFAYKRRYIKHDLVAALVVTAIVIPQSLAFAMIIGLSPITGLYTAMVAPIVFALLAHTKRLAVGPDSATAAVVASGAALVAQAGTAGHANAVAIIGVLTAVILAAMSLLRLGFLAELISRPVLIGFLAGVGVQLMIVSLPTMLGITVEGSVWQQLGGIATSLGSSNGMAVTVSVLVVGIIIVLRRTIVPGELAGLVLAIIFAAVFQIGQYGVAMVGALPNGLPAFALPAVTLDQVVTLLPAAISVALVVLAQGSAVIRANASRRGDKVRVNNDLFALGAANVATAVTGGYAANGSPVRTQAAESAGGKSQMVNVFTGILVGIVLLVGAALFQYVPQAALSSIVFIVGVYLIRFKELAYIWDRHRMEFFVAMVALVGTILFGVLQGVFVAIIVSLAERLSRQYHPRDAVLVRDGEVSDWVVERLGGSDASIRNTKGLLVYSFESPLYFENVGYFAHRLRRAIRNAKEPVTYIAIDAGAIDTIDYTAAEELKPFFAKLQAGGMRISFAHVTPYMEEQLEYLGIMDVIGRRNVHPTLNDALDARHSGKRG